MSTVLGIDSGDIKTLAALMDETGAVLDLRPDFYPTHGEDPAADLRRFFGALAPADLPQATTAGLPYYGEVDRVTAFKYQVATELIGRLARVCRDVEVAHLGAFAGDHGLLCFAGTGCMAWTRGPHGRTRAGIAAAAGDVSTPAASGDTQAAAILSEAGAEQADQAEAAARSGRLGAGPPLACAGSVFHDAIVRHQVVRHSGSEPVACRLPPVGGATLDAARRAGRTVDQAWISVLRDSPHQQGHA